MSKKAKPSLRVSAMLLFQFRIGGLNETYRVCEKRLIVLECRTLPAGLKAAKRYGAKQQFDYLNDDGRTVLFEFIGVVDFVDLTDVCEPEEVWYDIPKLKLPMERAAELVPSDEALLNRT